MKDIPYDDVLRPWGLEFRKSRPDLPLSGSPERSLFRTVIEDGKGRCFVLEEIRAAKCFDASGFALLTEFVPALRFAWLSDWLRKKDAQMVELEADFIGILLENVGDLRQLWV